jgi:hypothetical protein
MKNNHQKAWVVAVDMGYGHQRAAAPLREFAFHDEIINANNYAGIPAADKKIWLGSQSFYEKISRFKKVPLIGKVAFDAFDHFQQIPEFYPKRDLSDKNFYINYLYHLIKKKNWGLDLIKKFEKHPLPLITTFFVPAFMAEIFNYSQEIYAVVTDTDITRAWVPPDPERSRINYIAPSIRAVERLKRYGVRSERIFLTGFPLPTELLGDEKTLSVLKADVSRRILNLDPKRKYLNRYNESLERHLGKGNFERQDSGHPLTLMFSVGGAGAQRELGVEIVKSLKNKIKNGAIRIYLVAGTHLDIKRYFCKEMKDLGFDTEVGKNVVILHKSKKEDYFKLFNKALKQTDILWTKPSELSFYTALGMPIIVAPSIGAQEKFNRQWLQMIGSGIDQMEPEFTDEWLFDLINTGWFAEAAMQGFLEAPKFGTYNIRKIISHKPGEVLKLKTEMEY